MQEKLLEQIRKFNTEDDFNNLIWIFIENSKTIIDSISFLNENLSKEKINKYKFAVLKISDNFLVYINKDGEIEYSDTALPSLVSILKGLKYFENESQANSVYADQIKNSLLVLGKGKLKSYDVYTKIDIGILTKKEIEGLLTCRENWVSNRAELHDQIIKKSLEEVRYLSQQIRGSTKTENGLYCVRGSVASGKSTFVSQFLKDNVPSLENTNGVLNTDHIKRVLIKASEKICGLNLTGYVVHDEASMISERILSKAKEENLLYFIDKRMQDSKDLAELIEDASNRKLPVTIFDVNVDFMTSVLRVLVRTGVYPSDPTPDFEGLFKSYKQIEEGRFSFFQSAMQSKTVKNYYSVSPSGERAAILIPFKKDYEVMEKNIPILFTQQERAFKESFENVVLSLGKTVKESLDEHSAVAYKNKISKEEYYNVLIKNIENTSRTYSGELNVSASADKKEKVATGLSQEELSTLVKNNTRDCFEFIYNNKYLVIYDTLILKRFIDELAILVNKNIILEKNFLIRKGENSQKYNYVKTENVVEFYNSFTEQLYLRLKDVDLDAIETASWVEWNIDFCGHIFSDGCGRISKLLSCWLLMRSNMGLPDYAKGQDGFATIRESYRKRFSIKEEVIYKIPTEDNNYICFLKYYKNLFDKNQIHEKILASGGLVYNQVNQFLILQTSKGKDSGKWVIPGGKLEKGEPPGEAFKREVFEETGLQIKDIRLLGNRDYTATSGNHYHFYDYTSFVEKEIGIKINNESSFFKWIYKDEIKLYQFTDSIRNFLSKYFIENMVGYYKEVEVINLENLDAPNFDEHTMASGLGGYVESKLPTRELEEYIPLVKKLEVHGIYPDIKIISDLHLDFKILKIISSSHPKKNNSNSLRPIFLLAEKESEKIIVCCVTPGRDLLIHYASMSSSFFKKANIQISVYAYPIAEGKIDKWTGLDETMIYFNDVVILGYSTFFKEKFMQDLSFSVMTVNQNKFYTSTRLLSSSGVIVNCLEANYGHWGDISDYLSQKICQLGANEIIHIGKVGTFTAPSEVYKRIYIPASFVVGRRDEIFYNDVSISNSMEYIEEYSSLAHVSVSTTMEETFKQRDSFERHKIETIDIESSKIAQAVALYNLKSDKKVKFGAIHFSSDYLRKADEIEESLEFDLSTERDRLRKEKDRIMTEIYEIIKVHFSE